MKEVKELTAKDRLLNLYLDGEMTSSNAADYKSDVLAKDVQLRQEHEDLLGLRSDIRNYFSHRSAQAFANINSEQLWQKIATEIDKEEREVLPFWRHLSLPSLGFAFACALLAFIFGIQYGSRPLKQNYAGNSTDNAVLKTVSTKNDFHFELSPSNHEIVVAANHNQILHRLPIELDSNQLIGVRNYYPMRAQGVDIDWIKSDRNYKLVASEKSVPVIWVSGNKQ